jgi:hypothetical protein
LNLAVLRVLGPSPVGQAVLIHSLDLDPIRVFVVFEVLAMGLTVRAEIGRFL